MEYKKNFVKSDGRRLLKGGPRDQQIRAKAAADTAVVDSLMNQIVEFKSELNNMKADGTTGTKKRNLFTPEQVDEEIRKAVSQAMAEATISLKKNGPDPNLEIVIKKYKEKIVELQKSNDDFTRMHSAIISENSDLKSKMDVLRDELKEISELKNQIAVLEQSLKSKDELIDVLKTRPAIIGGEIIMPEDPDRPKMEQVFIDPLEKDAGEGMKSEIKIRELERKSDGEGMSNKVDKLKSLLGNKLPKNI